MKDETISRRGALRTVLSLGCGLLLPAAMVGCDTKSPEGSSGTAPPAPTPVPASPPATPTAGAGSAADGGAAKKMTPASVQYQAQPKGEQRCDGCAYFIAGDSTCSRVEGPISSEGWCVLWVKKA